MKVDIEKCTQCGLCLEDCGTRVIHHQIDNNYPELGYEYCSNCGHCMAICPVNAITLESDSTEDIQKTIPNPITFDNFLVLSRQRRSYRKYKQDPVPPELLNRILHSVKYIPTGCNAQELEITVITKPSQIKSITLAMQKNFKLAAWLTNHFPVKQYMKLFKSKQDAARNIIGPRRLTESYEKGIDVYFRDAPVIIIIHTSHKTEMMHLDAGIAGHHINLACETENLGCCWIGFHSKLCQYFPKIKKLSSIPRNHKVLATMILGYPKVNYLRTCPRDEIMIHYH